MLPELDVDLFFDLFVSPIKSGESSPEKPSELCPGKPSVSCPEKPSCSSISSPSSRDGDFIDEHNVFCETSFEDNQEVDDSATKLQEIFIRSHMEKCHQKSLINLLNKREFKAPKSYINFKKTTKSRLYDISILNPRYEVLNVKLQVQLILKRLLNNQHIPFKSIIGDEFNEFRNEKDLSIMITADGISAKKSGSSRELWPVVGIILNLPMTLRFAKKNIILIGLHKGKPDDSNFFDVCWNELLTSLESPIMGCKLTVYGFNGDLPATSLVCDTPSHNQIQGCAFCLEESIPIMNGKKNRKVRKWLDFKNYAPRELSTNRRSRVVLLDSMHLVYIGIWKTLFFESLSQVSKTLRIRILNEIGTIQTNLPARGLCGPSSYWKARDFVVLLHCFAPRLAMILCEAGHLDWSDIIYSIYMIMTSFSKNQLDIHFKARVTHFYKIVVDKAPLCANVKFHYFCKHLPDQIIKHGAHFNHWLFASESLFGDCVRNMPAASTAINYYIEQALFFIEHPICHGNKSVSSKIIFKIGAFYLKKTAHGFLQYTNSSLSCFRDTDLKIFTQLLSPVYIDKNHLSHDRIYYTTFTSELGTIYGIEDIKFLTHD